MNHHPKVHRWTIIQKCIDEPSSKTTSMNHHPKLHRWTILQNYIDEPVESTKNTSMPKFPFQKYYQYLPVEDWGTSDLQSEVLPNIHGFKGFGNPPKLLESNSLGPSKEFQVTEAVNEAPCRRSWKQCKPQTQQGKFLQDWNYSGVLLLTTWVGLLFHFYRRTPENTAFNGMVGANESTMVLCNVNTGWPIKGWPASWCQSKRGSAVSLQKRLLAKSFKFASRDHQGGTKYETNFSPWDTQLLWHRKGRRLAQVQ